MLKESLYRKELEITRYKLYAQEMASEIPKPATSIRSFLAREKVNAM